MAHHLHPKSRSTQGFLALALLLLTAVGIPATALAEWTPPKGTKGWTYYIRPYEEGYTSDPLDACMRTAKNHMNSELVEMRPSIYAWQPTMMYDCKYYNFVRKVGDEEIPPQWYGSTEFRCEPGYQKRAPGVCIKNPERPAPPPPPGGCPGGAPPGPCAGNPVVISSGAKIQRETDFEGPSPIRVDRTYRTLREDTVGDKSAGQVWSFSFDRLFYISSSSQSGRPLTISVIDGDGSYFRFNWDSESGKYRSSFDRTATLEQLDAGYTDWVFTHPNGRIDRFKLFYNSDHRFQRYLMVSSHTIEGQAAYYTYHPEAFYLQTISDGLGRELKLDWTSYAVSVISGPDGSVHYSYDWLAGGSSEALFTKRLVAVEYFDPNGASVGKRHYHYEDRNNRYLLTGVTDENGLRFANYAYDGNGRTVLSEHAGATNRYTFAYPDAATRVITDPLGTTRTFKINDFGSGGVITGQSLPDAEYGRKGGAKARTFDGPMVRSETDFNGYKTCYVNDQARQLQTSRIEGLSSSASCPYDAGDPLREGNSRRISTRWHPDFAVRTAVAEPRRIVTYLYNGQLDSTGNAAECAGAATLPNGKSVAVVCKKIVQPTLDPNGEQGFAAKPAGEPRVWTYSYNARGQILTSTGPADSKGKALSEIRTYYEDTDAGGNLASVTNSAGETTEFLEYTKSGMPTRVRRANGQLVSLEYGARQRLISISVEDATDASERSTYEYDMAGQLIRSTAPDGSVLNLSYDPAHRLIEMSDNVGNRVHFDLDPMGNVISEKIYGPDGVLSQKMTRSFDSLNRLARELGGADQAGVSYRYDGNGNLTALIDQLGRIAARTYDSHDRVVRDLLPAPTLDSGGNLIEYTYDNLDNITSVTDMKRLVTRYTVDQFGQRIRITSPDTGVTTASFDSAGNLMSSQDARGIAMAYEFDTAGRLVKYGRSTYEYGRPGTEASGLLTKMRDGSGETTFAYDGFGRLVTKSQFVPVFGPLYLNLKYAYGAGGSSTGHVTAITYPSGNRVQFTYGNDGHISSVALVRPDNPIPVPILSDIKYRPFGPVASWTWGNGSQRYQRVFDLDGKIESYPLGEPMANGVVRTLIYDAAGRIAATSHSGNPKAVALDQHYYYDGLDRLIGYDATGTSQRYSYDRNGNRTSVTYGAVSYVNTASADSNRLQSTSGPLPSKKNRYDPAGNLLSDGRIEYSYGVHGRMESARWGHTTTRYRYNGLGQRVVKYSDSLGPVTFYAYDEQGHLIGEYNLGGSAQQETIYLDDLPVAVIKRAAPGAGAHSGIYYVYSDHLQTPRVITRATDNKIVWRWDPADPFGLAKPEETTGAERFIYNLRFPGQVFDMETNTHYNYFRDYDPQLGRYLQSDPIGLFGGINTYTYSSGNPIDGIDPFGLSDLNVFNRKDTIPYNGATAWEVAGYYSVAGHGNSKIIQDPEKRSIYPKDLARWIRNDPNWNGRPIIIGACNTGTDRGDGRAPFGQDLADELRVPVKAPMEYVWFTEKGLLGTSRDMTHPPKSGQQGRWKTFLPRR